MRLAGRTRVPCASLVILVVISGWQVFARTDAFPPRARRTVQANDVAERTSRLNDLLQSIEGPVERPLRLRRTPDGYLRSLVAPHSSHYKVPGAKGGRPEEVADAFLERWRDLLAGQDDTIGFKRIGLVRTASGTLVRYQQTFAGLNVFHGEVAVKVDHAGGVRFVMTALMHELDIPQ